jgi:GntR family transcriptional regulator / MocR family aminotransferase
VAAPPAGPGGLDLHLELSATRPARALETALRAAIVAGRLPAGHRLPPTRGLATDLGIARATVADVYAQLVAEGWLESRTGAGTWVAATARSEAQHQVGGSSAGAPAGGPTPLVGGLPDASQFPRRDWLAATRRALEAATTADLGYPDPAGVPRLREQLATYLRRTRGVDADPRRVLVGHGFGSMLSLICRTLADSGARRVAVEEYGHPEHRDVIRAAGLEIVPLPVDQAGAVLAGPLDADAVLLTPSHQFPLGVPLSAQRRRALVAWASGAGRLIIEDDYDGEFRYERRSVGALQGIGPEVVAYLGTASKATAPAVGLSWAVVPEQWRNRLLRQRAVLDQPHDALNQLTLAEFFAAHAYDRHVRRMRAEYRRRRQLLAAELAAKVPGARVGGVAAGLQATVYLPPGTDANSVVAEALRRGLSIRTLADYAVDPARRHPEAVVVGYGAASTARAGRDLTAVVASIAAVGRAPDSDSGR